MNAILESLAGKVGPLLGSAAGKVLLTQTGAVMVIAFLVKYLPESKLYAIFYGLGKALSGAADIKLGRVFWEPFENFVEKSINTCIKGVEDGWNSDDAPAGAGTPPSPAVATDTTAAPQPTSNSGTLP